MEEWKKFFQEVCLKTLEREGKAVDGNGHSAECAIRKSYLPPEDYKFETFLRSIAEVYNPSDDETNENAPSQAMDEDDKDEMN